MNNQINQVQDSDVKQQQKAAPKSLADFTEEDKKKPIFNFKKIDFQWNYIKKAGNPKTEGPYLCLTQLMGETFWEELFFKDNNWFGKVPDEEKVVKRTNVIAWQILPARKNTSK